MLLALLFAWGASTVTVPPAHWTAIDLPVLLGNSTLHISFEVREHDSPIQAILLTRQDAVRFDRGKSNRPLMTSGFRKSDQLRMLIPTPGDYVLLLDNRLGGEKAAEVALQLDLSHRDNLHVTTVPESRKRATEALSILFLGAVVVLTALKFLRN